ncbi:mechanosensitive ion channel domain-containing protein [Mycolicibacterium hippocampi]|uniref:Membrane protein n=1 Tax=Mycolicibacterium hippocampi TaxID=659824 RepID=A0A7I9ZIB6_9MYCO|nr:mechanosensitive ion channel family protein [Mycolicibacterium hippocampi]GFH00586.1 membrane protein [Mycolicibacterium hippocampi]
MEYLDQPWFYWAVSVAVGLPIGLIALTELRSALDRRGSALTRPVELLRNYILPLAALLVLLTGANQVSVHTTPVRIVSTTLGFVVLVLLLSGLNATLFDSAPEGSWRQRLPTIFLDVARFAMIAIGLALILSVVWGANVGGLFTALGVSSIVLGLALQNSVGQIVSGLLLLFEQPFQIGDWLDTPTARGRVVEVNWRATHLETGSGLQVMPNSVLAGASFTNLSRPGGTHAISVSTVFAATDSPDVVCATLSRVAARLPQLRADERPSTMPAGATEYRTSIPLRSPADDGPARATFLRWAWYAARRAGLHLDLANDDFATSDRTQQQLQEIASTLRLTGTEQELLLPKVRLTRYGAGEILQMQGELPTQMMFVMGGRVQLTVSDETGGELPVRTLHHGDFLGQSALTREAVTASAVALEEVTVLQIDRDDIEELAMRKPLLLKDIGKAIEERRRRVQNVLAAASGQASAVNATTPSE